MTELTRPRVQEGTLIVHDYCFEGDVLYPDHDLELENEQCVRGIVMKLEKGRPYKLEPHRSWVGQTWTEWRLSKVGLVLTDKTIERLAREGKILILRDDRLVNPADFDLINR